MHGERKPRVDRRSCLLISAQESRDRIKEGTCPHKRPRSLRGELMFPCGGIISNVVRPVEKHLLISERKSEFSKVSIYFLLSARECTCLHAANSTYIRPHRATYSTTAPPLTLPTPHTPSSHIHSSSFRPPVFSLRAKGKPKFHHWFDRRRERETLLERAAVARCGRNYLCSSDLAKKNTRAHPHDRSGLQRRS